MNVKIDKIRIYDVIQFFLLQGKIVKEIHERTLGDSCPSYETLTLWVNEFKRGRTSIEDAPRPETPKSAVTLENKDKFHDIVFDRQASESA